MAYFISEQRYYYDGGEEAVEVALGLDNVSPGASAAGIVECDTALEAAEEAILAGGEGGRYTISTAAVLGLYPTVEDAMTADELREWAAARAEKLEEAA